MATTNGGQGAGAAAAPGQELSPQLNVLGQYVKDFSFENPNAPRSLQAGTQQPSINIQINVNAKPMAEHDFEVELKVDGRAESQGTLMFAFELLYAGIFRIQNVPQDSIHPLVMIECPRLLFPFARQMIADAIRNGGFPPLLIDPVDFVGLYRQKMAEQGPQQPTVA
jgi:preprotein translocase subunit SecB